MSLPVIRMIVSIDTEEDNWLPVSSGITTRNVAELPKLEKRFAAAGVRATYFTAYHVVAQPASAAVMRDIHASGRAEIGGHVHPWNTPPLTPDARMLLNLPADVQAAQLAALTERLTTELGVVPRSFRAGRFGLGPQTVRELIRAGYRIDSSVTPFFSWRRFDNGPSFIGAPLHLYRLGGDGDVRVPDGGPLIEAPLSCGYNRWSAAAWPGLTSLLRGRAGEAFHVAGLAARLGLGRRVILSPEPHDISDLSALADRLLAAGLPFLHAFWHSSSMVPGLTPFCRSSADVERLVTRFEQLLDYLAGKAELRFVTLSEAVAELGVAPGSPAAAAS